jgi:hypothetical protein
MPTGSMQFLRDSSLRVSVTEFAEIIDTDPITIDNWLRRKIIRRAEGARKFKSRLFSSDEVYKTALKNELVTLGIPPSSANDAVNGVWEHWDRNEAPVGQKLYVLMFPSGDNWSLALCSQKESGGPLYRRGKSTGTKSVEMDLPKRAFAVIPISDVFERVSSKIARLLGG